MTLGRSMIYVLGNSLIVSSRGLRQVLFWHGRVEVSCLGYTKMEGLMFSSFVPYNVLAKLFC